VQALTLSKELKMDDTALGFVLLALFIGMVVCTVWNVIQGIGIRALECDNIKLRIKIQELMKDNKDLTNKIQQCETDLKPWNKVIKTEKTPHM